MKEETTISKYLVETDPMHSDVVDSFAYAIATQEFKMRNEYTLMYLKKRPWFIPNLIYKWLVSKLFVMAYFK